MQHPPRMHGYAARPHRHRHGTGRGEGWVGHAPAEEPALLLGQVVGQRRA
jgi:hypothetical protein